MGKKLKQKKGKNGTTSQSSINNQVDLNTLLSKALDCLETFEFEEAIRYINSALKIKETAELYELLSQGYISLEKPELARQALLKSISLSPELGHAKYLTLGQLLDGKDALKYFHKGIELLSKQMVAVLDSENNNNNGYDNTLSSSQKKIITTGNSQFTKDELTGLLAEAYCSVCELYMTDLCFENDAESSCENALKNAQSLDPNGNNIHVVQTAVNFHLVKQDTDQARKFLKRVLELYRSNNNNNNRDNNGNVVDQLSYDFKIATCKLLLELGEYKEAEEMLEKLLEEWDDVTDVWYLMGVALRFQDDFVNALEYFEKAIELGKIQDEDEGFLGEIMKEIEDCKIKLPKNENEGNFIEKEKSKDKNKENNWDHNANDNDDDEDVEYFSNDDDEDVDLMKE